jgi:GntR family transcriptional repressor for pyruvate dehydrogenase complex
MRLLMVDIVEGLLEEGHPLPRESDLAEQFDVSRGVIREALRGLEERGLIVVQHGRPGATVTARRHWDILDTDVLTVLLQSADSGSVLAEYIDARRIIEVEAAARAAERSTAEDLEALATMFSHFESAGRRAAVNRSALKIFYTADIEFHQAILNASGNRVLARLTEPIQRALLTSRRPLTHHEHELTERIEQHRRIMQAIAARDVEGARAAMRDHLDSVEQMLRDRVDHTAIDLDAPE